MRKMQRFIFIYSELSNVDTVCRPLHVLDTGLTGLRTAYSDLKKTNLVVENQTNTVFCVFTDKTDYPHCFEKGKKNSQFLFVVAFLSLRIPFFCCSSHASTWSASV